MSENDAPQSEAARIVAVGNSTSTSGEVTLKVMWPTGEYHFPVSIDKDKGEVTEWLVVTQNGVKCSRTVAKAAMESTKQSSVTATLIIAEDEVS